MLTPPNETIVNTEAGTDASYEDLRAANIRRNEEIMRALGKNCCEPMSIPTHYDVVRAGLDRSDFVLHEAHKKSESNAPTSNKKDKAKAKKRKEPSSSQTDDAEHGVRRSARQLGIKAEVSERALSEFQDQDGTPHKSERALKELSASLAEHANAEREHLRWAGSGTHFCHGRISFNFIF